MELNLPKGNKEPNISPPDYIKNKRRAYTKDELVTYIERERGTTDFRNKEVLIHLDSFCVGDTICFSSFIKPFMDFYNPKKVLVTTFFENLLESFDERLVFIQADSGAKVQVDVQITVGYNKESLDHTLNGLFYAARETFLLPEGTEPSNPPVRKKERIINQNKVTIAPESLKKIARWDYPNGWQEVVNYIRSRDIQVYNVSYEDYTQLDEVINYNGFDDINVAIDHIVSSRFFIGLSSGLAWIAWAYGVPVVMISGFTKEQNEFDCYRVSSKKGCSGCFNIFPQITNSCPVFYGTERENECHSLITPSLVIEQIEKVIKDT